MIATYLLLMAWFLFFAIRTGPDSTGDELAMNAAVVCWVASIFAFVIEIIVRLVT